MVSSSNSTAARKPVAQVYFELLTLGDELLLGLTANGHLTFVGAQLGRRGVTLRRNITITDDAEAIVLGCAGLTELAAPLADALGVPVVDGVLAAVTMAEGLLAQGLTTSRASTTTR
jgi:hypothetical protein